MSVNEPPPKRVLRTTLYYLAIIAVIALLHGHGGFTTPKFIYQGF